MHLAHFEELQSRTNSIPRQDEHLKFIWTSEKNFLSTDTSRKMVDVKIYAKLLK